METNKQQKKLNKQQLLNSGIQGAAIMGRTYALIGSIIIIIISILLIIGGIAILMNPYKNKISATITSANCVQDVSTSNYNCSIGISYIVNNITYTSNKTYISSEKINQGDLIDIYYNSKNVNDFKFSKPSNLLGILLLVIGFLIILFSLIYLFFIMKYKALATISGLKRVISE